MATCYHTATCCYLWDVYASSHGCGCQGADSVSTGAGATDGVCVHPAAGVTYAVEEPELAEETYEGDMAEDADPEHVRSFLCL